jgi:hypothetical protein
MRLIRLAQVLFLCAVLYGCGPTIRDSLIIVHVAPGEKGPVTVQVGSRVMPITTDAQVPLGGL